ncbi:uncharacterized protein LOC133845094 [Drosophila sulfurigaster albostrigata]|uniref:uncharacterized protein LOC133845094 n=1 Tax=Drosophila sulfurigaster albostrigata TaxID=89887 RepID=UPI002D21C28A|nr:uncharacterized protein LOC133845094 [Drosophila sulfurigaster albostrigata]
MFKFVILLSVVACAFGAAVPEGLLPQVDGRIVGGTATTIGSFPWQISLQRSGSHSCGGSIFSANIIVTAAHCLQSVSASTLQVRAGSSYWSSGGVVSKVAAFRNHEGYNSNTMINDIAIIRLSSSLSFSSNIKAISLATYAPVNGAAAAVSGWGTLSSGSSSIPAQLQYVNVNIVSQSVCGSSAYKYGSSIRSTMICAAASGKDACQGDSGGPLVSGGDLVGVVSWGIGCAYSNYPGVYADVAVLRSWVISAANSILFDIMFRVVAILVCLAVGAWAGTIGVAPNPFEREGRIVGGEDTTIRAHPYQVSLQKKSGSHFCGGSLINHNTVVTAAHCLQGQKASKIWVRLGSTTYNEGGLRVAVESLIYNDKYSSQTLQYDVGLLRLAESVAETEDIRYIELAKVTPPTGTAAVVTGWGSKCYFWCMTLPKVLQSVVVYIVQWKECASDTYKYGDIVLDTMVCAYEKKKDACQGDSGGPLVANNQLVGIVSWGYGCAQTLTPGVYADVATLRDWIIEYTEKFQDVESRIIGGEVTSIYYVPYQVSLRRRTSSSSAYAHTCGGCLISDRAILTAAHCVYNRLAENFLIVAGTEVRSGMDGGVVARAEKLLPHEQYNASITDNDIALIFVSPPFPVGTHQKIATIQVAKERPVAGTVATVSGWGTTTEGGLASMQLQQVQVSLVDNAECQAPYTWRPISEGMLCAAVPGGGKDACQGDSGGPLVVDNQLLGIVSWGEGCARPDYPVSFTIHRLGAIWHISVFQPLLNIMHAPLFICLATALLLVSAWAHPAQQQDRSSPNGRIVGGYATHVAVHPHQISLRRKAINSPQNAFTHICGGSVICGGKYVVTAAHCIIASVASQYKVVAGTSRRNGSDGVIVSVSEIIMHEKYNPNTYDHDIAVLVLSSPFPVNNFTIKAIELASEDVEAGSISTITGWGTTSSGGTASDQLLAVDVPIVSNEVCNEDYSGLITDSMLCAGVRGVGGKDACQGDSGGPLIVDNKLHGVVSWGYGCAHPEYPGVYARVSYLREWIDSKVTCS